MKLADVLREAIRATEVQPPRGQQTGAVRPGARSYAVCRPCTDEAQALHDPASGPFRARGWLARDLPRHLRDYHHQKGET